MMADFQPVFDALRPLYARHAAVCVDKEDSATRYLLNTHEVRARDGYVTFFGGVEIRKAYVSAHLFPAYTNPDIIAGISDGLRKHMQGKSCFNFKTVDAALFAELGTLIDAGVERYKADGRL